MSTTTTTTTTTTAPPIYRWTQQAIEVGVTEVSHFRKTQVAVEVLFGRPSTFRQTQLAIEVAEAITTTTSSTSTTAPFARVTQEVVEVFERSFSYARPTQVVVEVFEHFTTSSTTSSSTTTTSTTVTTTTTVHGSVCYGHDTAVEEVNIRDFTGKWEGTANISGSGDTERVGFAPNQYKQLISPWYYGAGQAVILLNKYRSGSNVTICYKTASTLAGIAAASWQSYTGEFTSQGFIDVRLTKGLACIPVTTTTSSTTSTTVTTTTTVVSTTTTIPAGYLYMHDIGSNDEGLDGGSTYGNAYSDEGNYYRFNDPDVGSTNGGIYWSNVADESNIDVLVRFRVWEFDDASTGGSTIWKSGGVTNALAFGWTPDGELGVFARSSGALTSNLFAAHNLEENVWYDAYITTSKIVVEKSFDPSSGFEQSGSVTPANGADDESVGCAYNNFPITGSTGTVGEYSKSDVDMVAVYTAGNLTLPTGHSSPSSKLLVELNFGTSGDESNGFCYRATVGSPSASSTYVTFNGSNTALGRDFSLTIENEMELYCKFRPHNRTLGNAQNFIKSGGGTNGKGIGIDSSGNVGIFSRNSSSLTSITIPSTDYSDNTWYELYASNDRVTLVNVSTGAKKQQTGTSLNSGDGTGYEAIGGTYNSESGVISGATGEWFDGDIEVIRIYESGGVIHPSTTTTTT